MKIIDEGAREDLSRQIYEARRGDVGGSTATAQPVDSDDEDLIGYDSIEPGLPPASSDKRKWWLDNGKPARSDIKPIEGGVPNPNRPSNPYTITDEPDWVTVPRMPLGRTSSQPMPYFPPPPPNPRPSNDSRKLPPPFTPSSIASLTNNISQTFLQDSALPTSNQAPVQVLTSTNDRRHSVVSSTSTTSRKSAPPVGRKPVHLTSSPTLSNSSTTSPQPLFQRQQQSATSNAVFPPPPRRNTAASPVVRPNSGAINFEYKRELNSPPPPPQPRRSGATSGIGANGKASYITDESPKPGLPPRPLRDLLGDDDDELSGWEALKPS